jgi:hypothetical protein
MSKVFTKDKITNILTQLRDMHGAIDSFNLSGYTQRQMANNCMDAINMMASEFISYQNEIDANNDKK